MTIAIHRGRPEYRNFRTFKAEPRYGTIEDPPPAANDHGESGNWSVIEQRGTVDQQLVASAQAGQSSAFEELFGKYHDQVVKLVGRMVGEADAQDVAQEAFIKAYRAIGGFRGESSFYTWLYRVAVNSAKNYLVARRRRPAGQDIDVADAETFGHTERLSDGDTPESILLSEEMERSLVGVIRKLPSDLRQAIVLRELDGLTYDEIAEVMDCPIGTVRSRIFRARETIGAVVAAR